MSTVIVSDFPPWLAAILISKLLLYIAYAASVGGIAATLMVQRYKPQHLRFLDYAFSGVILGLIAASINFFLQVGSFSESGFAGMWDSTYLEILWQSGVGTSYQLRLIGWAGLLTLLIILRFNSLLVKPIAYLYLATSLLIAASFTQVGHTAEQDTWVRLALVLHIFIAMWWIGFLYPLRHCCQEFSPNTLQLLMRQFGKQASILIALLLLAGIGVSYILEQSFENLFSSSHGNVLLLKLGIVAAILALAARHKLRLVPTLTNHQSALSLQRSIGIEMGFAFLILIITAILSTLVGPSYL